MQGDSEVLVGVVALAVNRDGDPAMRFRLEVSGFLIKTVGPVVVQEVPHGVSFLGQLERPRVRLQCGSVVVGTLTHLAYGQQKLGPFPRSLGQGKRFLKILACSPGIPSPKRFLRQGY